MNTANERIKYLRNEYLGMTLDKFGERIGLKKSALSLIENGRSGATDQTIKSICREFGVSEDWLRTGEGEPFVEKSKEEQILSYFEPLKDLTPEFRARFARALAVLEKDDWVVIGKLIDELIERLKRKAADEREKEKQAERERLHDDLDRQLDEKGSPEAGRSGSTSGLSGTAG